MYCLNTNSLLRSFKRSGAKFIDFLLVEQINGEPILYCIDNQNEVNAFNNLKKFKNIDTYEGISKDYQLSDGDMSNLAEVKHFLGFNPKSQILFKNNEVYMVSADCQGGSLII